MPEEVKRKRGRPPKQSIESISEVNTQTSTYDNQSYEYSSYIANSLVDAVFSCGVYDYFSKQDIENILRDPITYHDEAIRLSNFVYTKNGIVSNSIDYMTSLPLLFLPCNGKPLVRHSLKHCILQCLLSSQLSFYSQFYTCKKLSTSKTQYNPSHPLLS